MGRMGLFLVTIFGRMGQGHTSLRQMSRRIGVSHKDLILYKNIISVNWLRHFYFRSEWCYSMTLFFCNSSWNRIVDSDALVVKHQELSKTTLTKTYLCLDVSVIIHETNAFDLCGEQLMNDTVILIKNKHSQNCNNIYILYCQHQLNILDPEYQRPKSLDF